MVQLITVSISFSLADNCLSVRTQWDEGLIGKQDNGIIVFMLWGGQLIQVCANICKTCLLDSVLGQSDF